LSRLLEPFGQLANLDTLNFDGCGELWSLPPSIGGFTKLKVVNTSGSGVKELPEVFLGNYKVLWTTMLVVVPLCQGYRNHVVSCQTWKHCNLIIVSTFKANLHLLVGSWIWQFWTYRAPEWKNFRSILGNYKVLFISMQVVVPCCQSYQNHLVSCQTWKDWTSIIVLDFKVYLHLLVGWRSWHYWTYRAPEMKKFHSILGSYKVLRTFMLVVVSLCQSHRIHLVNCQTWNYFSSIVAMTFKAYLHLWWAYEVDISEHIRLWSQRTSR
jgi:hypothetical protein